MTDGTGRDMLRHTVATLAYRGAKALRGAPDGFGDFLASGTSRTPSQILAHVCDLLDWALSQAVGKQTWNDSTPATWQADSTRFFRALRALDDYLASSHPLGYPPQKIFQGAIADALTHVGQINFLRRMHGAPVRGENYQRADIAVGQVGSDQPPPRREFD
ncbi:MAG TPA: hypothetical protein VF981_10095 [Gemmatimonadaceae bacterium]